MTSISTSVDIHQLSFRRPSICMWTSISFYMDVHQYLWGCLSAFIGTSTSTFVETHQLSYGCPSVSLWTSISFHTDGYQVLCGHPSVLYIILRASLDVCECYTVAKYGRLFEHSLMSISFHQSVHQDHFGSPSVFIKTLTRNTMEFTKLA